MFATARISRIVGKAEKTHVKIEFGSNVYLNKHCVSPPLDIKDVFYYFLLHY